MIVQNPPADPLSDLLALVEARPTCSVRLQAGGTWALRFMPQNCKFNVVRHGECWLETAEGSRKLGPGDCVIVKDHAMFVLSSEPGLPPVDAAVAFADDAEHGIYRQGCDVEVLGGSVSFVGDPSIVLDLLPPVLVLKAQAAGADALGWLIDRLDREWRGGLAGSRAACDDLLRLIFVHVLRAYFTSIDQDAPGWVGALADPRLGAAIRAIHAAPEKTWRLDELAGIAGRSRSSFAAEFRERLGTTPVEYATNWKFALVAARLRMGREPVSRIAEAFGFLSDSAFGAAFKRRYGMSPGRYRAAGKKLAARE